MLRLMVFLLLLIAVLIGCFKPVDCIEKELGIELVIFTLLEREDSFFFRLPNLEEPEGPRTFRKHTLFASDEFVPIGDVSEALAKFDIETYNTQSTSCDSNLLVSIPFIQRLVPTMVVIDLDTINNFSFESYGLSSRSKPKIIEFYLPVRLADQHGIYILTGAKMRHYVQYWFLTEVKEGDEFGQTRAVSYSIF